MSDMIQSQATPAQVTAALNSLSELDKRLSSAQEQDEGSLIAWIRGDFGDETVNLLRSEFARLWRLAEASSDGDTFTDVM